MKKQFLDSVKIVGTHGIKGEVRIEPWCDSPEFLCAFKKLYLDENGQTGGAFVYHAGTKLEDGKFLTAGGRVLGVTATGENLKAALGDAYKAVGKIGFEKAHYRKDIGQKALSFDKI